jgi:hypothetical protein
MPVKIRQVREEKMRKGILASLVLVILTGIFISLVAGQTSAQAASVRIVSGRVQAIYPVFGSKGSMTVESHGKIYTIYTGIKTNFHPPRWPIVGDWVRIRYIIDSKGYYRAYDVYID